MFYWGGLDAAGLRADVGTTIVPFIYRHGVMVTLRSLKPLLLVRIQLAAPSPVNVGVINTFDLRATRTPGVPWLMSGAKPMGTILRPGEPKRQRRGLVLAR